MAFSYREETRADRIIDWLVDAEGKLRVGISRLGAELISIQRQNASGEWIGFLFRDNDLSAPGSGWANHATVMGYFLHRLKEGRSIYRGKEIRGATHSFLRTKIWHVSRNVGGSLTYRITPDDFTATEYPLKVSLDLTYRLRDGVIDIEFKFANHEPELSAHVGFGIHPGFAASAFESFSLEMPAGSYRRYFSPDNYLSGETEDIDFGGGPMPFDRDKLPGSYIVEMIDTASRDFIFKDEPSGRSVIINMGTAPYFTLWSDGGPFLCVEPCWGLTDHHAQRSFEEKAGIQVIASGGELVASCSLEPRFS